MLNYYTFQGKNRLQISLAEKLKENPEFLNNYAKYFAESQNIEEFKVSGKISDHFEESKSFVRDNLDKKYKNQGKVSIKAKITNTKRKIDRLYKELTFSTALLETLVNSKK